MDHKIFQNKKILLVEDEPSNQELMLDIFENLGCIIHIAEDGNQAIQKFNENTYDLILMDAQMPDKDGYQTTREIRQIEKERYSKPTPILALTANALSGDREKCLEAGMNDYASKPINLYELRKKMADMLTS